MAASVKKFIYTYIYINSGKKCGKQGTGNVPSCSNLDSPVCSIDESIDSDEVWSWKFSSAASQIWQLRIFAPICWGSSWVFVWNATSFWDQLSCLISRWKIGSLPIVTFCVVQHSIIKHGAPSAVSIAPIRWPSLLQYWQTEIQVLFVSSHSKSQPSGSLSNPGY